MGKPPSPSDKVLRALRAFGLAYPGAHTKSPWPGHLDLAVNDKTFAYLSIEGEPFSISCKLPRSSEIALLLPFCTPTAYGLGKSGWVTATFPPGRAPPQKMLEEWIDESYRAQAPAKLVAQLDAARPAAKRRAAARRAKTARTPARTRTAKAAPGARRTPRRQATAVTRSGTRRKPSTRRVS